MNTTLCITCNKFPELRLRSIDAGDIEELRRWKNANSDSFFHTAKINQEQQKKWFDGYLQRNHDHMFIVCLGEKKIGCMGFRKTENGNECDIYNIILGDGSAGRKGYISTAVLTMCKLAHDIYDLPVTVKVLRSNPAVTWYKKLKFTEISGQNEYFYFRIEPEYFREFSYEYLKQR